jgi:hypothetical protein
MELFSFISGQVIFKHPTCQITNKQLINFQIEYEKPTFLISKWKKISKEHKN